MNHKTVWIKIITPVDTTFKKLHEKLQVAFNWQSYHLYDFNIFDEEGKCVLNVVSEFEEVYETREGCPMLFDSDVNLSELFFEWYKWLQRDKSTKEKFVKINKVTINMIVVFAIIEIVGSIILTCIFRNTHDPAPFSQMLVQFLI